MIKENDVARIVRVKASVLGDHFLNSHNIDENSLIEIIKTDPKDLLHYKRIDLIPKIHFVEDFLLSSWRSRTIDDYREIILGFSLGRFKEPGKSDKNSFELYLTEFKKIITELKNNGFDCKKSVIPVGKDGVILDGSHRLAAAIVLGVDVSVAYFPEIEVDYGANFFINRGLNREDVESFLLDYLKIKDDHQTFLLWPRLSDRERKKALSVIEEHSDGIIYENTFKFKEEGLNNLVVLTYESHSWVGSPEDKFSGAWRKVKNIYRRKNGFVTVVIIKNKDKNVLDIKNKVRVEVRCANDGCHSTDSSKESTILASYILTSQTRHMLNNGKPFHYPKLIKRILQFRENIDKYGFDREDFIIDSSTVIGLYGLRQPNDLDFLSLEGEFKKVEDDEIENNHDFEHFYSLPRRDLITDARNSIYLFGIKIMSLPLLIKGNKHWKEKKKQTDLKMAELLLSGRVRGRLLYLRLLSFVQRLVRSLKMKLMFLYPVYKKSKNIAKLFFSKLRKIITKIKYPNSYSQYQQDAICLKRYFSNISEGVFVEVGADDGISKSNTYLYELRGWKGLCIEPSLKRFKLLEKNRKCICENRAISSEEKSVDFMDISGYGKGLGGIVNEYDKRHKERIEKELEHPSNEGYEVIKVEAVPFSKILKKHNLNHVNFCTIDVEGAELSVLKSIDFDACKFDVILVENNYKDNSVELFMKENGFKKDKSISLDDVYVRESFKHQYE